MKWMITLVKNDGIMKIARFAMAIIGVVSLPFAISSCSGNPASPGSSVNLISNPDFQASDKSSLRGWVTGGDAQVVREPPPSDGQYSLQLRPGYPPFATYAGTYITGQAGTAIYKLTAWQNSFDGFGVVL